MAKLGIFFGIILLLLSIGKVGKVEKYFSLQIDITQTQGKVGKVGDIFVLILHLSSIGKVGKVEIKLFKLWTKLISLYFFFISETCILSLPFIHPLTTSIS